MKQPSMKVPMTMDIFQHRYYRLCRTLMKWCGRWPFQRLSVRLTITAMQILIGSTLMVPVGVAVTKNLHNWDLIVDAALVSIFGSFVLVKALHGIFTFQKMLMMLNHIRSDWELWSRDIDVDVLHEYGEKSRRMTAAYTVGIYAAGMFYAIQPIVPKILDVLLKNGTEPVVFPIPVDFHYIDMQKYYIYIVLHSFAIISMTYSVTIAFDCMFMVYIQHGCGLFTILGRKLQRIGEYVKTTETKGFVCAVEKSDRYFECLVSCITVHNRAIEYADLLDQTYTWGFFFIVGLNVLMISISGIEIITRTTKPQEFIRFVGCGVTAVWHLYVYSYLSQSLMDHSISAYYYIMNGAWYILPLKIQKILYFMLMRCTIPSQMTAGTISVMSIETFAVFLKTSLSYFTLFRSA